MGTYIAHEDLLRGFEVPLDLTVHGVQDDNAVIGEDIEHVSHTEAWEEQTQPWLCSSSSYRAPPHPPMVRSHATSGTHKTAARVHRVQAHSASPGEGGRSEMSRWYGEHGRRCPRAVNQNSTQRALQSPGVLPDMHISQLELATNTGFQINDSRGVDIHLTVLVLKGKAFLGCTLSTKFRMDEMIPPKQRLLF